KEKIYPYISWLLGTIFGAMIMFSNSGYHAQNNMRGLSNVDLNSFITSLLTDWTELYVKENALLLLLFAIVIYFLIENKNMFKNILFFFPTVYFVIRYILNISWANQSLLVLLFELLLIIIFLFSLIFIVGRSNIDGKNKRYFFSFLVISLVLVGPFLVVKPFGPRNILSSYIFLVLALLELVVALPIDFSAKKHQRVIRALVITLSCICLGMQATNKYVEHQRVMELRQDVKKEKTEIRFMRLPYEFLGHDLTPPDGSVQSNRQKSYHNVPRDTKLDIVDYQDPKLMELRQKNDSQ
ncbi:MAG TPA: hypothetical protein VK118_00230, partial [Tetragenococcus sp.]|nr:hypothetical protein [Tetragenococcus sp.]